MPASKSCAEGGGARRTRSGDLLGEIAGRPELKVINGMIEPSSALLSTRDPAPIPTLYSPATHHAEILRGPLNLPVAARPSSLAGSAPTNERPGTAAQGQWDKRYRASARDAVRYFPEARQVIIATPAAPSPSRWSRSGSVPSSAHPERISSRTRQPAWRSTPPGRSSGTSPPSRACVDARTASG